MATTKMIDLRPGDIIYFEGVVIEVGEIFIDWDDSYDALGELGLEDNDELPDDIDERLRTLPEERILFSIAQEIPGLLTGFRVIIDNLPGDALVEVITKLSYYDASILLPHYEN